MDSIRFDDIEKLRSKVSDTFGGWGPEVPITQDMINKFADLTGDHQWIHVDVERCRKESPFGTTIAHGYLTVAMLAQFSFEVFVAPAGITQVLNYGSDKLRFITPVKSGSRIRDRIVLSAIDDKGEGRLLVTAEHTVEIEGVAKPALVATTLAIVIPS
jgi:acyl dehydratase